MAEASAVTMVALPPATTATPVASTEAAEVVDSMAVVVVAATTVEAAEPLTAVEAVDTTKNRNL